jgi:hypothetical protein
MFNLRTLDLNLVTVFEAIYELGRSVMPPIAWGSANGFRPRSVSSERAM